MYLNTVDEKMVTVKMFGFSHVATKIKHAATKIKHAATKIKHEEMLLCQIIRKFIAV